MKTVCATCNKSKLLFDSKLLLYLTAFHVKKSTIVCTSVHLHACEETDEQCERQRIYEAGTVLPVPGNATEGVAFVAHHQLLPPTTTNQMLPIFVAQRHSPRQCQSQSQMMHFHHVRFFRTFANLISQRDKTIPASTVSISFLKLFSVVDPSCRS